MDEDRPAAGGDNPSFVELADALHLGMAYQVLSSADGRSRRFTHVGSLCREMTGLSPEEVMDDPGRIYDQILPEHRAAFDRAEAGAIATLSGFEVEVRMRGPDGATRWRRIASRPRPQPDGAVIWDGLMTDVTEARHATEALREQRRRLEVAVEATGLGFWEWDVRNDRITWSERNRELFGAGEKGVFDIARYAELVHPDDRDAIRDVYQRTLEAPGDGDFVVEHRTALQPGGRERWLQTRGRLVKDAEGVHLVVGTTLDISERKAVEDARTLLLGELAHRAKNGIQVMMAIVAQTARSVSTVHEFETVLNARLRAMAESHDLVTASGGRPVALADVVAKTLTPFDTARFEVDDLGGTTIAGDVAVALALLLHELATNAVKYGALSAPAGCVKIRKTPAAEGEAALAWTEEGGPIVATVGRKGFGSRLLEVSLRQQGGRVESRFEPGGFQAAIHFPVAAAWD
ncbi:sensor histidine kinase [Phenylobacterium zucineum HLK1]|uniref:histidine kinase n=1 Tax=Phenylobacterium zucineum (strain HLK1) TaxID=450851 RepID=B4R9K2_PHEZH|nr:sensor histidine kinase [Phenylobacterium zucineum]ACG79462.1 sensor histidine kinase [Phenylobacterium zucineum HLK1]